MRLMASNIAYNVCKQRAVNNTHAIYSFLEWTDAIMTCFIVLDDVAQKRHAMVNASYSSVLATRRLIIVEIFT